MRGYYSKAFLEPIGLAVRSFSHKNKEHGPAEGRFLSLPCLPAAPATPPPDTHEGQHR